MPGAALSETTVGPERTRAGVRARTRWSAPPAGQRAWMALGGATALALVLRLAFVGDQSLGYEEIFTSSVTGHGSFGGMLDAIRATESTPPLYYALTWLWVTIGADHSAVALRMSAVLAGTAAVPVAFLAARRFVGNRAGLATATLFAVSPLLVQYAIYARSYALMVLVMTLSVWALGAVLERPSWIRWGWWALAAAACLWTHYFTAFLIAAEGGVLFVLLPQVRARLLAAVAGVAVAFAPLWSLFQDQRGDPGRTAFIAARPLRSRLEDVVRQFSMGTNVPHAWLEGVGIAVLALAVVVAATRTLDRPATRVLLALAAVTAGVPIVATLAGAHDYLLPRNIVGALVCLAPLAAWGLLRARGLPLAVYGVVCVATVLAVQTDWRYHGSPDWQAASRIIRVPAAGQPIAVIPAIQSNVAGYYTHRTALGAPVRSQDLWVMVQPARGAHQRALGPVANATWIGLWDPSFRVVSDVGHRGFRLVHLHAPAPVLVPARAPDDGRPEPQAVVLAP